MFSLLELLEEVSVPFPGQKKPILRKFIPEDDPAAHEHRL